MAALQIMGASLDRRTPLVLLLGGVGALLLTPPAEPAVQPFFELDVACQQARLRGDTQRLRGLQRQLLVLNPAPQPLPVVLANAEALLQCGAPEAAQLVLARHNPAPGPEQAQLLLLQWRAAAAALDHPRAAAALRSLAAATGQPLELLQLPLPNAPNAQAGPAQPPGSAALDLLAGHLEAMGQQQQAAQLLFASGASGVLRAQRLARAVGWAHNMPLVERITWLEQALDQAAAAGAWGLALELLDQQLALLQDGPASLRQPILQRRMRLGGRLDDRAAIDPERLRSPRDPGGHAADPFPVPARPQP